MTTIRISSITTNVVVLAVLLSSHSSDAFTATVVKPQLGCQSFSFTSSLSSSSLSRLYLSDKLPETTTTTTTATESTTSDDDDKDEPAIDLDTIEMLGRGAAKAKRGKRKGTSSTSTSTAQKVKLEEEIVYYEGPPAITETIVPTVSILTVVGIIPAAAAWARQAWVRYKITSRRIRVQSGIGGKEMAEIVYPDIIEIRTVKRLFGDGDMVVFLRDGAKFEMRNIPEFDTAIEFILKYVNKDVAETYRNKGEVGKM